MINFALDPFEWQKCMDNIMQNVNLSEIKFLSNRSVLFSFLNSFDGNFYKQILCNDVWKFLEENNCVKGEDFPFFICDVRTKKLEYSEAIETFHYFNYGFAIPKSKTFYLLCMDSGNISISLICETIEII